jgi:hypothetical protein
LVSEGAVDSSVVDDPSETTAAASGIVGFGVIVYAVGRTIKVVSDPVDSTGTKLFSVGMDSAVDSEAITVGVGETFVGVVGKLVGVAVRVGTGVMVGKDVGVGGADVGVGVLSPVGTGVVGVGVNMPPKKLTLNRKKDPATVNLYVPAGASPT